MPAEQPQRIVRTQINPAYAGELVEALDKVPLVRNIDLSIARSLGKTLGSLAVSPLDAELPTLTIHERVQQLVEGSRIALEGAGQRVGPFRRHKLKKVFYE